jgi:hypothetical protein
VTNNITIGLTTKEFLQPKENKEAYGWEDVAVIREIGGRGTYSFGKEWI